MKLTPTQRMGLSPITTVYSTKAPDFFADIRRQPNGKYAVEIFHDDQRSRLGPTLIDSTTNISKRHALELIRRWNGE